MTTTKKVILVEDNPADVELTKLSFENQDIQAEIVHCMNGRELLDLLPTIPLKDISFILLDLNMPQLGGKDILKIIRENIEWRKLPIIVFTSSHNKTDVKSCYELGANAYVLKPINLNDFEDAIRTIASFWGEINVMATFN